MQNKQYILIYYCIVQRNFRCQTMKVKPYIILNTSRKHVIVNYEEDKNKVPMIGMDKPYNIQNTNICNGIFHISFFKALLINKTFWFWFDLIWWAGFLFLLLFWDLININYYIYLVLICTVIHSLHYINISHRDDKLYWSPHF